MAIDAFYILRATFCVRACDQSERADDGNNVLAAPNTLGNASEKFVSILYQIMCMNLRRVLLFLFLFCSPVGADPSAAQVAKPWFGIHVVDEATGRGIPLIEFRTVNDNAGWIAFNEPGLMNREVWLYLSLAPGYEMEKDGFGYTGKKPYENNTHTPTNILCPNERERF